MLSAMIVAALDTADREGNHVVAAYLPQALAMVHAEVQETSHSS